MAWAFFFFCLFFSSFPFSFLLFIYVYFLFLFLFFFFFEGNYPLSRSVVHGIGIAELFRLSPIDSYRGTQRF